MPSMRRFPVLLAMIAALLFAVAPHSAAADAPIGRLGDTLRVVDEKSGIVADVTVVSVEPSEIPPGFGYPPRPPREQVYKALVIVQVVKSPHPHTLGTSFIFNGVNPVGDAYQPRNSDNPDALRNVLLNAPAGSTVSGYVYWDCYREPVTHVVLTDKKTGFHLAQWNL